MITPADEEAIRKLPSDAWQAAVDQDGTVQKRTAVTGITHLTSRLAGGPAADRPPHETVPQADEEPDRVREGHRMRYSVIVCSGGSGLRR
jgi:hypothetical protein